MMVIANVWAQCPLFVIFHAYSVLITEYDNNGNKIFKGKE